MKLLKYTKMKTEDYILTIYIYSNWFMRTFFRKKGYKREYIGSGTVWQTFPDFERCSLSLEYNLYGFYKKIKFDENNEY